MQASPSPPPIRVLLVEDDAFDARFFTETLVPLGACVFQVVRAPRLSIARKLLDEESFDVIAADLGLPDSTGLETFRALRLHAPETAIAVLTGLDDEKLALCAVRDGAQEYLVKGQTSARELARALRYAIERQAAQTAAHQLALRDELTGLYNRRGFLLLSQREIALSRRGGRSSVLIFADLDGLKRINDDLGHEQGDLAIIETAQVLKTCFRDSDIVARLGGDEFAALAIESSGREAEFIEARVEEALLRQNERPGRRYDLSLSLGALPLASGEDASLEQLLAEADRAMYVRKRARTAERPILASG
jgi:diguanylate cyclase (GGDEF)-like protein